MLVSARDVMGALATILPAGTPIATVIIQKGLQAATANYPAIILNCPTRQRRRAANQAKQWAYHIHVLYLDRWEDTDRTLEQIMTDADTTLTQMVANVEANRDLIVGGVAYAGDTVDNFDVTLDGPVKDAGFGFPMVTGEVVIEVPAPWDAG